MNAVNSHPIRTDESEIERLGLRHRVWRASVLDLWQRAGLRPGMTVIDAGAGPGHATFDLAGIVGPGGHVIALERAPEFVMALIMMAGARDIQNVAALQTDLADYAWPADIADAVWCRWVLGFVTDARKVLGGIARALKPGGVVILHEYYDCGGLRLAPQSEAFETYLRQAVSHYRMGDGDPDIGLTLPEMLGECGLVVEFARPAVFAVRPDDEMWQWPAAATRAYSKMLAESGVISIDESRAVDAILEEREADTNTLALTPGVLQIVARKPV